MMKIQLPKLQQTIPIQLEQGLHEKQDNFKRQKLDILNT